DISCAALSASARARRNTSAKVATPAAQVGQPRSAPSADAVSSATAITTIPPATILASFDNGGTGTSAFIGCFKPSRCDQYKATKVTTIAMIEGSRNRWNHSPRPGICPPNTTRLAGFDTGSTKLAAFAISAQANRCGSGFSSLAALAAASTAG